MALDRAAARRLSGQAERQRDEQGGGSRSHAGHLGRNRHRLSCDPPQVLGVRSAGAAARSATSYPPEWPGMCIDRRLADTPQG